MIIDKMDTSLPDGEHLLNDSVEIVEQRYRNGSISPTLSLLSKHNDSLSSHIIHEDVSIDSDNSPSPAQVSIRYDCDKSSPDENIRQKVVRSKGSLRHLCKRSSESALNKRLSMESEQLRHLYQCEQSRHYSHTSLNRLTRENEARKTSAPETKTFAASLQRRCSLDSNEILKMSARGRMLHLGHSFHAGDKKLIEEYPIVTPPSPAEDNAKHGKLSGIFRRRSGSSKSLGRKPTLSCDAKSDSCDAKSDTECCHLKRHASLGRIKRSNSFSGDTETERERDKAIEEWGRAASKCEELIEELECTLTELILIKCDRDEKERELQNVMIFYEHNMDDRDKKILEQTERIQQDSEKIDVARRERTEAYEQRDELLQHSYRYAQEVETMKAAEVKYNEENRNLLEKIEAYENQVKTLKSERDHAVQLWKETTEERKKVCDEQIVLAQAKDEALQKTFDQTEEINTLKAERDQLKRHVENAQRVNGLNVDETTSQRKSDSGFLSALKLKQEESGSENQVNGSLSIPMEKNGCDYHSEVISSGEEYEDIAICMDTLDSRVGWKLDNAFDIPRVMVSLVTPQAEQKWNIKKHDRILSVNSTSVQRANKKTVERLIRDATGRTISLVLRREKPNTGVRQHADVDLTMAKQHTELGLQCGLQIKRIKKNSELSGIECLKEGDVITKINSQDTSEIVSSMILKLIKKWSGRATFRVKREGGFQDEKLNSNSQENSSKRNSQLPSLFNFTLRRKSSATSSDISTPKSSIFTDISSLFSYSSDTRNASDEVHDTGGKETSVTPQRSVESVTKDCKLRIQRRSETGGKQKESNRLSISTIHNSLENLQDPNAVPLRNATVRTSRRPKLRLQSLGASIGKNISKSWLTQSGSKGGGSGTEDCCDDSDTQPDSPCLYQLSRYATLPRSYHRKSYTIDTRLTTRVIRIDKEEDDPIGFSICGGNRIGIFVTDLSPATVTEGLKIGDRILSINSSDLSKATLDFAMRVLLLHRCYKNIRMEVKHYPNFEELMTNKPYESLYVRCLQSYTGKSSNELSFDAGNILHITDTLVQYDSSKLTWCWYGERTKKKSKENVSDGVVPWIEPFTADSDLQSAGLTSSLENLDIHDKRKRRTLIKTAQDLKKWLSRRPSWSRKKEQGGRKSSANDHCKKNSVYYEILLEEQVTL